VCRSCSRRDFFVQPTVEGKPNEIAADVYEQAFFLATNATGYDYETAIRLPSSERRWNVHRLYKKLMDEKKAQEEALKKAQQQRRR